MPAMTSGEAPPSRQRSVWADLLEQYALEQGLVKSDGSVSTAAIAERTGLSQPTVSRILSGKHRPDYGSIQKIAAVAGAPEGMVLQDTAPLGISPFGLVLARKIDRLPKEVRELINRQADLFLALAGDQPTDPSAAQDSSVDAPYEPLLTVRDPLVTSELKSTTDRGHRKQQKRR